MTVLMSMKHPGRCSVCGKRDMVVTFGDQETRKVAYVCEECSKKLDMKAPEFVKRYGKKDEEPFKKAVNILQGTKTKAS